TGPCAPMVDSPRQCIPALLSQPCRGMTATRHSRGFRESSPSSIAASAAVSRALAARDRDKQQNMDVLRAYPILPLHPLPNGEEPNRAPHASWARPRTRGQTSCPLPTVCCCNQSTNSRYQTSRWLGRPVEEIW